jgi:release factor glutamine methyltransferase
MTVDPPAGGVPAPPPPGEPWTILHLVRWSAAWLEGKGIPRARLDVELLLADVLGMDRLRLYLQFDRPLVDEELAAFRGRLRRRGGREPLQYILGRTAFRELALRTDARALIPRPETEELVGAVLAWAVEQPGEGRRLAALDVGTGTGAIALSLALEGPFRWVVATDRSPDALALARENRGAVDLPSGAEVEFREGSLFDPLAAGDRFDAIVSNPPYIADAEWEGLQPEVRDWEPRLALTSGAQGLELLEALVAGAPDRLRPGGLLALEIGAGQGRVVEELLRRDGRYQGIRVTKDLSGLDRIVTAHREGPGTG